MARHYVAVAYEIDDDARRKRLSDLLTGYGVRVQKSVFEADLDTRLAEQLQHELTNTCRPGDGIRMYRFPSSRANGLVVIGGEGRVHLPSVILA